MVERKAIGNLRERHRERERRTQEAVEQRATDEVARTTHARAHGDVAGGRVPKRVDGRVEREGNSRPRHRGRAAVRRRGPVHAVAERNAEFQAAVHRRAAATRRGPTARAATADRRPSRSRRPESITAVRRAQVRTPPASGLQRMEPGSPCRRSTPACTTCPWAPTNRRAKPQRARRGCSGADTLAEDTSPAPPADAPQLARLVRVYEKMRPKQVAQVFDSLPDEQTVAMLSKMNDRAAAKVIAAMDPTNAARLSQMLVRTGMP